MSDIWVLIVITLPLIGLVAGAVIQVARRSDLTTPRRIGWILALVLIPVFGLAFYIVARPPRAEQVGGPTDVSNAEAIVILAERRQRGKLTDTEYQDELAGIASIVSIV
jgi:uncharacterized membrane protein